MFVLCITFFTLPPLIKYFPFHLYKETNFSIVGGGGVHQH